MDSPKKIKVALVALVPSSHMVTVSPVAIQVLAGHLREVFQDGVELALYYSRFESVDDIAESLQRDRPDIIGLSLQSGAHQEMAAMMVKIRLVTQAWPKLPMIVFGNVLATFAGDVLLSDYPDVIMVMGEGERALEGLVRMVMGEKKDMAQIPNLVFKQESTLIRTPRQAFDLGCIAFPYLEYVEQVVCEEGHIWVEASRGCNSRCTFCSRFPVRATGWTPIAENKVMDVIVHMSANLGVKHLRFTDDDFLGTDSPHGAEHAIEIAKGIKSHASGITFDISARADAVYSVKASHDENKRKLEVLSLLKDAGLTQVFLGVESGSCSQLKRFGKRAGVEDNVMAIKRLLDLGIQVVLGFITIDYLMNIDELEENIQFLHKVGAFDEEKQVFVSDCLVTLNAMEGSAYVKMLATNNLLFQRDQRYLTYNAAYKDERVERVAVAVDGWRKEFFL